MLKYVCDVTQEILGKLKFVENVVTRGSDRNQKKERGVNFKANLSKSTNSYPLNPSIFYRFA